MQGRVARRFCFALAAEIIFFVALNFCDNWSIATMPVKFVVAAILCGVAYLFAVSQFEIFRGSRQQAAIFWSVAILLRLCALPLAPADDFWRYEWEGSIQQRGYNPYVLAPDAPELASLRARFPDWKKINHRDFRAIYPPGAELIFAGLSRISRNPLLYKCIFAAADLGTIVLLVLLIGGEERFARAAWYAWNPLVAYSFAGAAHFDSLMILPMVASYFFMARFGSATNQKQKWCRATFAALALGVAISIKLIPALLLLVFACAFGFFAFVLLVSLAIPLAGSIVYGFPKIPIWNSLGDFIHVTRLNDLFWWLIEDTIWSNPQQKNFRYNVVLLAVAVLLSIWFFRNWKRGILWVLGAALILSPVLHPWYCTWILPIATWRRAYAWHVLSITLFAYYLFWDPNLFRVPWQSEPWLRAIIILPPLCAFIFQKYREARVRALSRESRQAIAP